jgi:hypothetical protein
MTRSKEVAERPSAVPDLVHKPKFEITSEDIALPRIYLGQYSGDAVKERRVDAGCIYVADGPDDPMPTILWRQGEPDGVVFHVLDMYKGLSYSAPGEPLQLWKWGDPNAHEEAWTTYNYTVYIPGYDDDVPAKLLLTRTGRQSAQAMNRVIKKNESTVACWAHAFALTCKERPHPSGKYYQAQVAYPADIQGNSEALAIAEKMAVSMTSQSADIQSSGEEPAI